MGLISAIVRLAWFCTIGFWLAPAYFIIMFLMSPFFTLGSGKIIKNTRNIMWLKTDWN